MAGIVGCNCRIDEDHGNTIVQWCQYHWDMREERDKLAQLAAFLRSVIKSGEPWSEQCETKYLESMFKTGENDHASN